MAGDWLEGRRKGRVYPPGETGFSLSRTRRFIKSPRDLLVECYERFGPVFTVQIFHAKMVFMIGPAANHYMTVTHASQFLIRESNFREMIPIVGDSLLTTDGEFHRESRRLMQPAFSTAALRSYLDVIVEETERAMAQITTGEPLDMHVWTLNLVKHISMRTLFGFDPQSDSGRAIGEVTESLGALSVASRAIPGPFTSWARFMRQLKKLDALIYEAIAERRRLAAGGDDVMSRLVSAREDDGDALTDQQIRDQAMTLLLASVTTTSSTLVFLLRELMRHPHVAARVLAEQERQLGDGVALAQLVEGELSELEMALDETLRLYPSVWIGPRRAASSFEFEGVSVPEGAYVNYCPWASHHLPEVFPEPHLFKPERFAPESRARLPKGAHVPFGGGPRTCIGMRFARQLIRASATLLLRRFTMEPAEGFSMEISQLPMIVPKHGLPVILARRAPRRRPAALAAG